MKILGVYANLEKPGTPGALERLAAAAESSGLKLAACEASLPETFRGIETVSRAELLRSAQALLVLGGDGTMLGAVRFLEGAGVPLLGIHLGGLGFMNSVPLPDLEKAVEGLAAGRYAVSGRTLLRCEFLQDGRRHGPFHAMNDVALGWGTRPQVITLALAVDGKEMATFVCDGLLVATPTGSTAHTLAAGGPIMHPDTPAFLLCPVCPHTLSNRPVVMPDQGVIEVDIADADKDLLLATDGQVHYPLRRGDRLTLRKSERQALFLHLKDYNYYALLREKLHWRGSSL